MGWVILTLLLVVFGALKADGLECFSCSLYTDLSLPDTDCRSDPLRTQFCPNGQICITRATVKRKDAGDTFHSTPYYVGRECVAENNPICRWQEIKQKCKTKPGDDLTLECGQCCQADNCTIQIGELLKQYSPEPNSPEPKSNSNNLLFLLLLLLLLLLLPLFIIIYRLYFLKKPNVKTTPSFQLEGKNGNFNRDQ